MRILISGASGLVGARLVPALTADGHVIRRLVRRRPRGSDECRWDPLVGIMDPAALAGCEAVIHLAGESIAAGRWTRSRKGLILASRVSGTRLIAGAIARAVPPPRVLICASAVGYYGDRGDDWLDEQSPPGEGFLADVVQAWEAAAAAAVRTGIRVVQLRFGIVLAREGGALPRLILPFRFGIGGPIGTGRQWQSWITAGDLVRVVRWVLGRSGIAGAVNVVAPGPVRNHELARAVGRVLGRPSAITAPSWALQAALGQMGRELLLFSQRVAPTRLQEDGFVFEHTDVETAMRSVLTPQPAAF